MNTTININRLGLLLKRYFIENKQLELTLWIIATVVFMIFHKTASAEFFLIIAGFIFASNSFKVFNITPSGIHYLLIPATHAEKLIVSIILSTFYFFIMFLLTYSIGTTIGTLISNFIFSTVDPVNLAAIQNNANHMSVAKDAYFSGDFELLKTFVVFAGIQSVFMLGSIYFKSNAAAKTLLTIMGLFITMITIEAILFKTTFGVYSIKSNMQNISIHAENIFSGFDIVGKIIGYLLIPFFWIVTYFRLTEKEV